MCSGAGHALLRSLSRGGVEARDTGGPCAVFSFAIEANGYGAILADTGRALWTRIQEADAAMAKMTAKPLASFSHEPAVLPQQHGRRSLQPSPQPTAPEGMVKFPAARSSSACAARRLKAVRRMASMCSIRGKIRPRRFHEHAMTIKPFFIDKFPVTNAQFKKFLDATHYRPRMTGNFLRDWKNGTYPQGWDERPVTWVSLEDARAYAAWAGKRLPHEWEWQYAAQGTDGRAYPWGNDWKAAPCLFPTTGAPCAVLNLSMRTRRERARSV